jgi:hypothetical protein
MALLKTITVEDFYTKQAALDIAGAVYHLPKVPTPYGQDIPNFNLIPPDADALFSSVMRIPMTVDSERSGVFRLPDLCIHSEDFKDARANWVFAVALQESTFNLFAHESGSQSVLDGNLVNCYNLFEWDVLVNYQLAPGHGVFFRPWLYHSFSNGLINIFRLSETNLQKDRSP